MLGFLSAARKEEDALAREFLDTSLNSRAASDLAHQLYVVLNARFPARLEMLSDAVEGSRSNPLTPNLERVGTVNSAEGRIDIVLERVARDGSLVWLFSRATLNAIGPVYEEVAEPQSESNVVRRVLNTRMLGVRVFEWLSVIAAAVGVYFLTALLNRLLRPMLGLVWRRVFKAEPTRRDVLPIPARLLTLAVIARWLPPAFQKGVDIDAIDSAVDLPYDIPNVHVEYVRAEPPAVPTGFWRGVGPNNNVFAA